MVNRLRQIPILLYHNISEQKKFYTTSISRKIFSRHIRYLARQGYAAVTFNDILSGRAIPRKAVIITFDDGCESVFRFAYPLLKEARFRAVIFIVAKFIGMTNYWDFPLGNRLRHLAEDQVKILVENGWEVGSHGNTHRSLPLLNSRQLIGELRRSRSELQRKFGADQARSIAYPFGHWNHRVLRNARDAGYRFGVVASPPQPGDAVNLYCLPRHPMLPFFRADVFREKNGATFPSAKRLGMRMLRFPSNFVPFYQYLCRRQLFLDN